MSDDEIEREFQIGVRDLARAESARRPGLPLITHGAQRRRRRSRVARSGVAIAGLAALIGVGLVATSRASDSHRVSTSGLSTATSTAPPSPPPTKGTPTTTIPGPVRTLPWIGTVVEPNTRDTFAHTLDATGVRNAPTCTLGDLFVTAILGGAGGAEYAAIKVRNIATHPCIVQGSPVVRFLDGTGRSLGGYAPNRSVIDAKIVLLPGSWAAVGLTPVGADHCGGPNNDTYGGTTAAAIAFGIDASATRIVRAGGDPPRANGCPPSPVSSDHVGPFEPIPVSVTSALVLGPLSDGVVLDAPKQVRRGETVSYSITLANTSLNSLVLVADDCPLYRESIGSTASGTLLLNCGSVGLLIQSGASVRFEMRLAVPADQPLGPTTLRWQFIEPQDRALSSPVTVVDGTRATAP
jgi:Protein of unknown function (DUF4232)